MRIRRRHLVVLAVAAIGALAAAGAARRAHEQLIERELQLQPIPRFEEELQEREDLVHTHTDFAKPADKAKGGFIKRVQVYFDNDFKFNTGRGADLQEESREHERGAGNVALRQGARRHREGTGDQHC
jgi:hypothetical protein